LYFRFGGYRALLDTAAFHVTSEMERAHVESFVPGAVTGLVQNGVEVPSDDELARWTCDASSETTVLYLGRVHPKKNVIPLVRAWASIVRRHPGATLVIAGPDDHGHRAEVERVIANERLGESVTLAGTVTGEDKHRLLARAACLVLPSRTENFGNVVAEALVHRVPAIASTGTPWSGLRDHACGWWLPPTIDALAGAIDGALSIDDATRVAMGARGRSWMIEEFSWPTVARAMRDLYDLVVSNRRIPG
jgi:glycosyltransferase involved in cell wall biosynthesis